MNKNWYTASKITTAALNGEYWIIDGKATFADGDVIDSNHASFVQDHIISSYLDKMGVYSESSDKTEFEEALIQYGKKLTNSDDVNQLITSAVSKIGMSDEEWSIVFGDKDPRPYGMKNLGWKRVHGNNIETYLLNNQDIEQIRKGVWDILEQEGDYDTEETNIYLNIEVVSQSRKFYRNIPLSEFEEGRIYPSRQI